jgi:hypothetical protein
MTCSALRHVGTLLLPLLCVLRVCACVFTSACACAALFDSRALQSLQSGSCWWHGRRVFKVQPVCQSHYYCCATVPRGPPFGPSAFSAWSLGAGFALALDNAYAVLSSSSRAVGVRSLCSACALGAAAAPRAPGAAPPHAVPVPRGHAARLPACRAVYAVCSSLALARQPQPRYLIRRYIESA